MLRLAIRHRTRYLYKRKVEFGQHRLVIRPREGHDLVLESFRLEISPAHEITWVRDVFGNSIALVDFTAPSTELDILSDVVLRRIEPFPERRMHEPWLVPWPVAYEPMDAVLANAYLVPTHPEEDRALRDWLAGAFEALPQDAEGTMLRLCEVVKRTINYRRRLEKGVQTPAQTLRLASGSCRDMATLLMDCARLLGVAARFASGYLHGTASLAGRASTHAWTEVFLPGLGWRGLDPTLGKATSLQHVTMGLSHHPRGVMPVSGTFDGTSADFAELQVNVHTEELATAGERAVRVAGG